MTSQSSTKLGRQRDSLAADDELLLLGLLSGSAMHGYQLNEVIEQRLPLLSRIKPSTAYSLLDRLAARGLVQATVERVGRRPERNVYALTDQGRERFLQLLRENLCAADLPAPSSDLGVLFHRALPGDEVAMLLAERRAATAARRPHVEEMVARHALGSAGYLIAKHTLVHIDAELAWLDQVLERGLEGTP